MLEHEVLIDSRNRPSLLRSARPSSLVGAAAVLGFAAAVAHDFAIREHAAHWWGYGAFFAVVGFVQLAAAVLVYARPSRRLLLGIGLSNLVLIGLWALSRSVGTPFIGPHAGHTEPVGAVDLFAASVEALQTAIVFLVLRRGVVPAARPLQLRWMTAAVAVAAAAAAAAPVGAVHAPPLAGIVVGAPVDGTLDEHLQHPYAAEPTPEPPAEERVIDMPTEAETVEEFTPCLPRTSGTGVDLPPAPAGKTRAIVYSHEGDLWLATLADGEVHRLTVDAAECFENSPVFRDDHTVTFSSDQAIYNLDLRNGDLDQVVEVPGGVGSFAWNGDRTAIAYFTWGTNEEPPTLFTYSPATRQTRSIKEFSSGGGRCGSMDDEMSITWSADGGRILVVATYLDFADATMFVVDPKGTDLVDPRLGTHAAWLSEDRIVYREFSDERRWFELDLSDGRRRALPMKAGTHHAAVSPDGRYVATTDDTETPSLYLYDTATRTERVLTHGYAAPIWLSSDRIAVSKTAACAEEMCVHSMWMVSGTTFAFDLSGERTGSLPMSSTVEAAALRVPGEPTPSPSPAPAPPTSPDPSPSPSESPTPSPEPTASTTPDPDPTPTS